MPRSRIFVSGSLAQPGDDRLDAGGDIFRRVAAGVVGTDHDHGQLRLDPVDIAVIQPPQHVLRLIAADARVHRLPRTVVFLPHGIVVPALRDRVAEEDQIDVPLRGAGVDLLVTLVPIAVARHGDRRGWLLVVGKRDARSVERENGQRASKNGGAEHAMTPTRVRDTRGGTWESVSSVPPTSPVVRSLTRPHWRSQWHTQDALASPTESLDHSNEARSARDTRTALGEIIVRAQSVRGQVAPAVSVPDFAGFGSGVDAAGDELSFGAEVPADGMLGFRAWQAPYVLARHGSDPR